MIPAIFVSEMLEVFEDRIVWPGVVAARSSKILALTKKSSFAASIAKSMSLRL
jgi:hypothetical protein